VCLIFTGDEPCDEHKNSFVPYFGFTGRICTPSFAENPVFPRGSDLSLRKDRLYGTKPTLPKHAGSPATGLRRWGGNSWGPTDSLSRAPHRRQRPILFLNSISKSIGARRTAVSVRFAALGTMFLRRASQAQDTLPREPDFNRRIFSVPRASYQCGFKSELCPAHARSHRLARSATIPISYHK
jgi:hypothetical protein